MLSTSMFGPRPCWRRSTISMHGSTKSVARMTSAAFTPGPGEGLAQHEGQLHLDQRPVHAGSRSTALPSSTNQSSNIVP